MSLEIVIDPHGIARVPFNELRDQLVSEERKFTETELGKLPYHEIRLAAIANAGTAICSIEDVVAEKKRRRYRFLTSSPDELGHWHRYLAMEGMLGEVNAAIEAQRVVNYDTLTERTKLWLKLNCLHNHTDVPKVRLREAYCLILNCLKDGSLVEETAKRFRWDIDHLATFYPHGLSSDQLRNKVGTISEELLDLLTDDEFVVCSENVVNYSCTSDCYRTI